MFGARYSYYSSCHSQFSSVQLIIISTKSFAKMAFLIRLLIEKLFGRLALVFQLKGMLI